eukprot:3756242-Amphidinium_carterae.2
MSGEYRNPWHWWPNATPEITVRDLVPSDGGTTSDEDMLTNPANGGSGYQEQATAAQAQGEQQGGAQQPIFDPEWSGYEREERAEEQHTSEDEADDEPFVTGHMDEFGNVDLSLRRLWSAQAAMMLYANAPEMEAVPPEVPSPVNPEKLIFMEYFCPPLQAQGECEWAIQYHDWFEVGLYHNFVHYNRSRRVACR